MLNLPVIGSYNRSTSTVRNQIAGRSEAPLYRRTKRCRNSSYLVSWEPRMAWDGVLHKAWLRHFHDPRYDGVLPPIECSHKYWNHGTLVAPSGTCIAVFHQGATKFIGRSWICSILRKVRGGCLVVRQMKQYGKSLRQGMLGHDARTFGSAQTYVCKGDGFWWKNLS